MYTPPAFREDDPAALAAMIGASPLATLVTATADGLLATPLPLLFDPAEGPFGVLHGHLARANPQWRAPVLGEALATFSGPGAYVSPGWYASKAEHGKVVPTWNYAAVHAYGTIEFFEDPDRLLQVVGRLTDRHEAGRTDPWAVSDAPSDFLAAQLRGIVGVRMVITRLEGKRKMSQNRSAADRAGVAQGLAGEPDERARRVAREIPALVPGLHEKPLHSKDLRPCRPPISFSPFSSPRRFSPTCRGRRCSTRPPRRWRAAGRPG